MSPEVPGVDPEQFSPETKRAFQVGADEGKLAARAREHGALSSHQEDLDEIMRYADSVLGDAPVSADLALKSAREKAADAALDEQHRSAQDALVQEVKQVLGGPQPETEPVADLKHLSFADVARQARAEFGTPFDTDDGINTLEQSFQAILAGVTRRLRRVEDLEVAHLLRGNEPQYFSSITQQVMELVREYFKRQADFRAALEHHALSDAEALIDTARPFLSSRLDQLSRHERTLDQILNQHH